MNFVYYVMPHKMYLDMTCSVVKVNIILKEESILLFLLLLMYIFFFSLQNGSEELEVKRCTKGMYFGGKFLNLLSDKYKLAGIFFVFSGAEIRF